MKDTEAFGVVHDSGYCCGTFERDSEGGLEPVVIVSRERYCALAALEKQWAGADDDTMWQAMFGEDGQLVIPPGWSNADGPVAKGDRVLVQGSFAKWWAKASRDPGCDASAYELVIRKESADAS